jgi:transcriptional regulator with GAF, ATPase, and Fis domain
VDRNIILKTNGAQPLGYIFHSFSDEQLLAVISTALKNRQKELLFQANEKKLNMALERSDQHRDQIAALLEGARSIMDRTDFPSAAKGLFDACKKAIGATAGYVALLSEDGRENEVLFLDAGGRECSVDPYLPMPIRGLRNESYKSGQAVYDNDFPNSRWWDFMPEGHVPLDNVLFAPINISGKTVGLLGLANCSEGFNDQKAKLATAFGEMAAVSLRESRVKEEREKLISQLQNALNEIKTLQGIIPICSHCKQVRDDDGFWRRVDEYIQSRSAAQFSHSICPKCMNTHYSDYMD